MGGFLGGMLGPGINALSTVVGGAQGAFAKADQEKAALVRQQIAAQRQAKEDQLNDILKSAQARHLDTQSNQIENPTVKPVYDSARGALVDTTGGTAKPVAGLPDRQEKPGAPVVGSPEWKAAQVFAAKLGRQSHQEDRAYDRANPMPLQEGSKATEFSNKAALVYPRSADAATRLNPAFEKGMPAHSWINKIPGLGNYGVTSDEQATIQAAETVSSAILRLESGAAISEHEVKEYAKQFLPQPGDDKTTRDNKKHTLTIQLERMRQAANPTLSRDSGPTAPKGRTVTVNGKSYELPE